MPSDLKYHFERHIKLHIADSKCLIHLNKYLFMGLIGSVSHIIGPTKRILQAEAIRVIIDLGILLITPPPFLSIITPKISTIKKAI
jgi:hypothetical protein